VNKILCIGEALIDMICTDKGSSLSEGQNFLKKPGGAPTNVAAAIAALGGTVELAAKVGADPFGRHLIEVMESFGVSARWMLQDKEHFTTLAFVSLMENGERDFYFNRGADGQLSENDVNDINLAEFSIVHFGSATGFLPGPLQAAYSGLLARCLQNEVFISFDPNYRHLLFQGNTQSFIDQSWKFLQSCHFFKVSDEEALLLTGASSLEEATAVFLE
jgi:fructokinase